MARRRLSVFSLSFLDAITCGFGAVILFFMIINGSVGVRAGRLTFDLRAEVDRLEKEVLEGHENLVDARNSRRRQDRELVQTQGLSRRVLDDLTRVEQELAASDKDTLAAREHFNRLKSDIQAAEEANRRLSALSPSDSVPGDRVRAFLGEGDRQYLTGLNLGGKRILILVDASASMLGERLVNVLRRRNLDPRVRRQARKWKQAVATVEWLLTQLPEGSEFQVYSFNTATGPVLASSGGGWLRADDRSSLDGLVTEVKRLVPDGGTSLHAAFSAVSQMKPRPDNLILLTDGLPTQGEKVAKGGTVSGRQRMKFFNRAVDELPRSMPVNTILFPMEGDPLASSAYWQLAAATRGSYLTPTRDWP